MPMLFYSNSASQNLHQTMFNFLTAQIQPDDKHTASPSPNTPIEILTTPLAIYPHHTYQALFAGFPPHNLSDSVATRTVCLMSVQ
jgi:hypothetical protein